MKKILLFGFDELPVILAVEEAAKPFDAEVVVVPRNSYGQTLSSLLEKGPIPGIQGLPLGEPMMVFCGLNEELDDLLPTLPPNNWLKAGLTPSNRGWNAARLFGELRRERRALQQ